MDNTPIREEMQEEKPHLSFSQITMYLRCPKQWQYRYVEDIKIPPAGALVQGSAVHSAVEANLVHKLNFGELADLEQVKTVCAEDFDLRVEREEVRWEEDETPGILKDQAVGLVEVHYTEIAPAIQPLTVEEKWRLELPGYPYDLVGRYDLVEADAENHTLVDLKTVGKTPSQEEIDRDLQFSVYWLAYHALTGIDPFLRLDALVKLKSPKAMQLATNRTDADGGWVLGLVEAVSSAIDSGIAYPNPNGWHCSEKWCGYWGLCKGGAR